MLGWRKKVHHNLHSKVWNSPNFAFLLLAFFVPLIIRAIPEVLMGPYVTGFDTMGHYVPTTLLWMNGSIGFWSFVATAPLFYSIVLLLVSSGGALITVLKILPPILLGFLGLSVFGYAQRGLGWSSIKSLVVSLFATLYFVALRISWDMLRNELALILFFVVLTLFSTQKSFSNPWKRYLLLSLTMSLVVLAHQLVSLIMFGVIGLTIAYDLFKRKHGEIRKLIITALPALTVFIAIFYLSPKVSEFRLIFGFSQNDGWLALFGYSSYGTMLASLLGFFLFCFLPLLPFIVLGAKRLGNFQMHSWVLLGIIGAIIPMVSPSNLRWIMMLTYPFAFYVTDALSRIKLVSWKRFKITLYKIVTVYLILTISILSLGFILLPPEYPLPFFNPQFSNAYVYQMPTSMLQNTLPLTDCKDTINALQWLKINMTGNSVLLSHRAFYGWTISNLNKNQVVLYEYDNPLDAAKTVNQTEHSRIYLVWWVNETGWYGQPTVSPSFHQVYNSGKIAIYIYAPN
jgi:hypothetical protein